MADEHRIDYHAGVAAALKATYDDKYDFMETIKELILGEKPPRLDEVVLKKDPVQVLSDEIGSFFREHNVFEIKGYGDGINIDVILKAQAYALFYKTIDRHVNEIPFESITITALQYRYPRETFKELEKEGCAIKERSKGVWVITGPKVMLPFQIVDVDILGDEWAVLKVLVPGASEKHIQKVQNEFEQTSDPIHRQHLADVLRTSVASNPETYTKMREAGKMSEAVEYIFADKIEEIAEKKEEKTIENMLRDNVKAETITKWTGASIEKIAAIAKKIGISTLTL